VQIVATAALFLATKVEEMHKRLRQVMDAVHCVLHGGSESAARVPGEDGSPEFLAARDGVLEAERVLLYTLEFDVAIDQPYAAITQVRGRLASSIRAWPPWPAQASFNLKPPSPPLRRMCRRCADGEMHPCSAHASTRCQSWPHSTEPRPR